MSEIIIPLAELDYKDLPLAGGKASLLRLFSLNGCPVPDSLLITGELYRRIISGNDRIMESIGRIKSGGDLKPVLASIMSAICETGFPEDFIRLLSNRLPVLQFPYLNSVSVLPSPVFLESPVEIMPDIYHSSVNISNHENLLYALRLVMASLWSLKAQNFRSKNYIPHEFVEMALIIQRMPRLEYSGVVYSQAPENPGRLLIRANWGYPGAVLKNRVESDSILVECLERVDGGHDFRILDEKIPAKDKMLIYRRDEPLHEKTPPEKANIQVLGPGDAEKIAGYAYRMQKAMGRSVFLIWGMEKDIFILDGGIMEDEGGEVNRRLKSPAMSVLRDVPSYFSKGIEMSRAGNSGAGELLGRVFVAEKTDLDRFQLLKTPDCFNTCLMAGIPVPVSCMPGESLHLGFFDYMKIGGWAGKTLDSAGKYIGDVNSFIAGVRRSPLRDMDKPSLVKILEDMVGLMSGLKDRSDLPALMAFSLAFLCKITGIRNSGEIYGSLSSVPVAFDCRLLADVCDIADIALKSPGAVQFFASRGAWNERNFDLITESELYEPLTEFIRKYDFISPCPLDVSIPCLSEQPHFIFDVLSRFCSSKKSVIAINRIKKNLSEMECAYMKHNSGKYSPPIRWDGGGILSLISRLSLFMREHLWTAARLTALMRKTLLFLGKILCREKTIRQPEDVFYLDLEEICHISGTARKDYNNLVDCRKYSARIFDDYSVPGCYSGSRFDMKLVDKPVLPENSVSRGIPLGTGKGTGRARVIGKISDYFRIEAGDMIITERLNPVMVPLLALGAGGIVERIDPSLIDLALGRIIGMPLVGGIEGTINGISGGDSIEVDSAEGKMTVTEKNQ